MLLDAASADTPAHWEKAPAVSGFDFLLVLFLIPLGLAAVISFLAFIPTLAGDHGYQPGQSWRGESEWFGGPRRGIAAADEVTSEQLEAASTTPGAPVAAGEPFSSAQLAEIDRAIRGAETTCRFEFSVFVGASDGESRPFAQRLHAALASPDAQRADPGRPRRPAGRGRDRLRRTPLALATKPSGSPWPGWSRPSPAATSSAASSTASVSWPRPPASQPRCTAEPRPGLAVRRPSPGRAGSARRRRRPRARSAWRPAWRGSRAARRRHGRAAAGEANGRGKRNSSAVEARWVPFSSHRRVGGVEVLLDVGLEDVVLALLHEGEHDAALRLVGDVVAHHRDLPGLGLRLGGGPRRARRGRPLLAGDGVVATQLGRDPLVVGAAGAGQGVQQAPAQVGVDGQAVEPAAAVEQALEQVERLVGVGGAGEATARR